jgi:hypothetical protein
MQDSGMKFIGVTVRKYVKRVKPRRRVRAKINLSQVVFPYGLKIIWRLCRPNAAQIKDRNQSSNML